MGLDMGMGISIGRDVGRSRGVGVEGWILCSVAALGLVGALVVLSGSAGALEVEVSVPGPVPTTGAPVDARVSVDGVVGDRVEVKLWLGGGDWQASRTFNGSGFERSDRYVLEVSVDGERWTGWVPFQANPDSRNAERLRGLSEAVLGARVRTADGRSSASASVALVHEPSVALASVPPGGSLEAVDGGLVVHRSNPSPRGRVLEVALPRAFAGRVCLSGEPCSGGSGLVLDRVGAARVRVRNVGDDAASLAGAVAVLADGVCGLAGEVASGGTRSFALADAGPRGASGAVHPAACLAEAPRGPWDAGAFWRFGHVVERAPDPPGWGDAVREAWGDHAWAPWRLPAGVQPRPFRMHDVSGVATAFATEAAGLERVLQVVEGARERLTVATYVFTNPLVADALVDAARRGVNVEVVLEPTPVGGLPGREEEIVDRLESAGVGVRFFGGPVHVHGLQHAKVVVADGAVVLVLTENLTMHGLPPDGEGNLGLGVGVANASLAGRVEALFGRGGPARPWQPAGWAPFDGRVGVLVSPSNAWRADAVPAWLAGRGRVDGLALRASPAWGPRVNAWLDALAWASGRHPVRVLTTGTPAGAREDNRLALAYLEGHPRAGALQARAAAPSEGTVHAKALLAGDGFVVGSSNWGLGGVLLNREVGLVVEDEGLAEHLGGVFDRAWNGTGQAPPWRSAPWVGGAGSVLLPVLAGVLAEAWTSRAPARDAGVGGKTPPRAAED